MLRSYGARYRQDALTRCDGPGAVGVLGKRGLRHRQLPGHGGKRAGDGVIGVVLRRRPGCTVKGDAGDGQGGFKGIGDHRALLAGQGSAAGVLNGKGIGQGPIAGDHSGAQSLADAQLRCGLRRRGYTPTSIFTFVREAGISKSDNLIDMRQLEACIRSELDLTAQRRIAVLDPVKLIVDNYPEDKTEYFDVANNPNREANDTTTRKVAFTRELWIENEDFAEVPPPKFKRLTIGGEVRLMGAYIVKCTGVEKNADGSIAAIHCTADLETGNGNPADGRKVKGTIHWVSAAHAVDAEVRLYDKLFTEANMNAIPEGSDYKDYLNPESVVVCKGCKLEESLKDAKPGEKFQFVRTGFFTPDSKNPGVYNRVVTLRDSFKPAK